MLLLLMMINMIIIRMIKIVRITSGVGRSEAKLAVLSDIARSWYVWFCNVCNNQVCYGRPLGPHHEGVSSQLLVSWGRPVQDQAPDQDGDHGDDFVRHNDKECGKNLEQCWTSWFWWRPAVGGETWPCCWKPCGLGRGRTWRSRWWSGPGWSWLCPRLAWWGWTVMNKDLTQNHQRRIGAEMAGWQGPKPWTVNMCKYHLRLLTYAKMIGYSSSSSFELPTYQWSNDVDHNETIHSGSSFHPFSAVTKSLKDNYGKLLTRVARMLTMTREQKMTLEMFQ